MYQQIVVRRNHQKASHYRRCFNSSAETIRIKRISFRDRFVSSSASVVHINLEFVNKLLLVLLATLSEEAFFNDDEEALTSQVDAAFSTIPVKLTALLPRLHVTISSTNTKNVFTVVLMSLSIL